MAGKKLYFNWSSGKDSALAVYSLLNDARFDSALFGNDHQSATAKNKYYKPVLFARGETVLKKYKAPEDPENKDDSVPGGRVGFWFCDLIPVLL